MKKRFIFSAVIAAFAMLCGPANAQGVIAPGHVIGNGNAAAHTATDAPLSSVMDQSMCPTQGDVPLRGASVWACAVPPTGFYGTVAANKVLAGPTTGSPAASAYRLLVGADLPLPSASSLGGVEAITSLAHNWIAYIDTSGVPHQSQPAFTDLSGTLASTQCPTPTVSTIGCVEAINSLSHNWIAYVDTSGVPHQSQPTIGDLASIGAYSLIGNTTSGSAAPGAFTVGGLTNKSVPASTDILLIQDQAAGGALKYCTLAQCEAAVSSGVSSLNALSGALSIGAGAGIAVTPSGTTVSVALALTNASLEGKPSTPTGNATTTPLMMGLGTTCKITPTYSGRVRLSWTGTYANAGANGVTISRYFGTSTAPSNGAAVTGTLVGNTLNNLGIIIANANQAWSATDIITGLTPSTAYWFDLAVSSGGSSSASVSNLTCAAAEF